MTLPPSDLDLPEGISAPALGGAARPGLCTDCGVSRMGDGRACGRACQFIRPDYPALEAKAHGRAAHREGARKLGEGAPQPVARIDIEVGGLSRPHRADRAQVLHHGLAGGRQGLRRRGAHPN
jgi:hypothetical protein